ncbi:MAG: 30S ribosomal protein S8 [Thiotrichales bacterium]|nr:MAG: 30S ribosomal protein S8 [Thiotrichales bacterium]
MSMQDPISDMLTRIRNGQMAGLKSVSMFSSNMKVNIATLLKREGYISDWEITDKDSKVPHLNIVLKYFEDEPVIQMIKRVSKPGLRTYKGWLEIPKVRGGLGRAVMSTNDGVITDREARIRRIGGEVLFFVA